MIELGDYVEQKHPINKYFLKRGIVVESNSDSFVVQWLSCNKDFFLEFKGDMFEDLNKRYLLTKMSYARTNNKIDIVVLSKVGANGVG